MHAKVKDLPEVLKAALSSLGYAREDISVEGRESEHLTSMGEDGCRAFACVVNLSTGERKTTHGSWGGPNAFTRNAVDGTAGQPDQPFPIPLDVAVIVGSHGGNRPVYATISVHPSTLAPLLPSAAQVSCDEYRMLTAVDTLTGGPYRREAIGRIPKAGEVLAALVARGLLRQNKAGAVSITTEGKNARNSHKPDACGGKHGWRD